MTNRSSLQFKFESARLLAEINGDGPQSEALYLELLAEFRGLVNPTFQQRSDHARCAAWFACYLESCARFDEAEEQYISALTEEPTQPLAMGNYAVFLYRVRKDRVNAAKKFEEALAAHPSHVSIVVKYANLKKASGDLNGAERLYKESVVLARSDDGDPAGAYAVFLHAARDEPTRAMSMYERAVKADPTNANNLSNFGLFLFDVMGNASRAEEMYKVGRSVRFFIRLASAIV
jgi:Tfp pilus assembly protein PilF